MECTLFVLLVLVLPTLNDELLQTDRELGAFAQPLEEGADETGDGGAVGRHERVLVALHRHQTERLAPHLPAPVRDQNGSVRFNYSDLPSQRGQSTKTKVSFALRDSRNS